MKCDFMSISIGMNNRHRHYTSRRNKALPNSKFKCSKPALTGSGVKKTSLRCFYVTFETRLAGVIVWAVELIFSTLIFFESCNFELKFLENIVYVIKNITKRDRDSRESWQLSRHVLWCHSSVWCSSWVVVVGDIADTSKGEERDVKYSCATTIDIISDTIPYLACWHKTFIRFSLHLTEKTV